MKEGEVRGSRGHRFTDDLLAPWRTPRAALTSTSRVGSAQVCSNCCFAPNPEMYKKMHLKINDFYVVFLKN